MSAMVSGQIKGVCIRLGFLAKILPPAEDRFYDFFEEAAEVCQLSAYLFYQIVHSDPNQREECLVHTRAYKRRASEALGGKGGGGRPDMAQAGGPDGSKAADAVDAVAAVIAG